MRLLVKENVDAIIYEGVSNSFAYAAYLSGLKHEKSIFWFVVE